MSSFESINDLVLDPAVLAWPDDKKNNACFEAAVAGNLAQMIFFEAHGANLHVSQEAFLCAAVTSGHLEVVDYLVSKEANVHVRDDEPLCLAAKSRHETVVNYLLEHGANVHARNDESLTHALKNGDYGTIRVLLKNGANLRQTEDALDKAIRQHDVEIVKIILESGHPAANLNRYKTILPLSSPVLNFLKIAQPLLAYKDDPKGVAEYLGIRDRKSLKSDAYQREVDTDLPYFIRCALHSLSVAVAVGKWPSEVTKGLASLVRNDIERVETTTGLSWKKYHESLAPFTSHARDARDLVEEVASVLILPEMVIERGKADLTKDVVDHLYKLSIMTTQTILLAEKTTADFLRLNRLWHQGGNRAPIELRPLLQRGGWFALLEPLVLSNGITVVCLNSPAQLTDEGERLHHCVGGYSSACQRGHSHILSFRKDDVSIATLELSEGRGHGPSLAAGRLRKGQFRGDRNSQPTSLAEDAWKELRKKIDDGLLPLSEQMGLTKEANDVRERGLTPLEAITGFSLTEFPALRPKFLQHYRSRVVIKKIIKKRGVEIPLIANDIFSAAIKESIGDTL